MALAPFFGYAQEGVLQIATIERPPFAMQEGGNLTGFSIELWEQIAEDLDLEFEYQLQDEFGVMLEKVESEEVDLAIANISITQTREEVMDFSHPIFDSGLQILTPKESNSTLGLLRAVLDAGVIQLVLIALAVLIAAAHVVWYLERGRKGQAYFSDEYPKGLWDTFWWAFVIVTIGGFEERAPRTVVGRGFAILWTLASLFIVSLFVAKFASVLTVSELQGSIADYNDLYGKNVATIESSTSDQFLTDKNIDFESYTNIDDMFRDLERGNLDAIVHDAPIVTYYAATRGRGRVQVSGPIFKPEKFGIALPENSDLVEPINQQLLKYNEDGTYERLYDRWFDTQ